MTGSCSYDGCTVDDTGACALERDPSLCANLVANKVVDEAPEDADDVEIELQSVDGPGNPVLKQPIYDVDLPSSRPLGLKDLNALMGSRYVNVVGILGDPESGKTACLASLYLLVSHAKLEGWSFADSKSLTAFEEIARGARDWNEGKAPEQMTVHTELSDDHSPGFLHLRLVRESDQRRIDFALPDMPGEWTQALVSTAQSDRLNFIKSAETIWVVLDGRSLVDVEKRNGLLARVGQLAGRLRTMLEGYSQRLIVVVTHRDSQVIDDRVSIRLKSALKRHSEHIEVVSIAPFSDNPNSVPAGFGISELMKMTAENRIDRPTFWQSSEPDTDGRLFLSYRRSR
ncbi:TRAFAC clade GTPase domain-containing protein [Saccharospirillum impatiens]|uniref:TRAFAC clade GTPase domain-containing protein n=1 Tax=Saccharospirillum impatiens TaxID=169438 RepID=UPI000413D199|nr:hypothetical protein [Saccharospirillum impatiens]